MPVYEYECNLCNLHFERKQGFDEEPVAICPECQGKAHQVIHSVPIIFKGSGFYVTDNRKGGVVEKAKGKAHGKNKRKGK
ncbi:FmdB family zinc ribbon protein [Chloroflexota bacterium]